ncbi:MAG: Xaa-Pro peptidase family protein, partial [Gemmatimonadota bacterium]|nr:Xaa-Pro peptidase family protein [Gemmatimonadota bacterium]
MRQRLMPYALIPFFLSLPGPVSGAQEADGAPGQDTGRSTPEQEFFDWTEPPFPAEEYAARRERFLDALGDAEGVVLIPSAHGLSHGETFRQADDFNYFTGLELPGSVLVLDIPSRRPTLFVPGTDFRFENPSRANDFPGRPLANDPALAEVSQIPDIRPYDQLDVALGEWMRRNVDVYVNPGRQGTIRRVVTTLIADWDPNILTLFHLQTTFPNLRVRNVYEPIAYVRMVKSPLEIEAMRASVRATDRSIRAAAGEVRDGVTERALEAAFEGACKRNGAQRIAFASIIKSGPNSLWPWRVLSSHYDRRNREMKEGDLVIFDVGCEVDHYVSDVGRTFPVSGRFSPEQRAILEMEVGVADAIISAIRPGMTLRELQVIGNAAIPQEHRRFMQTGFFFGHHIGLSTGDPNLPDL